MDAGSPQHGRFGSEAAIFLVVVSVLGGGGVVHGLAELRPIIDDFGGYGTATQIVVPLWTAALLLASVLLFRGAYLSLLGGEVNRGLIATYLAIVSFYVGTGEWSEAFSVPSLNLTMQVENLIFGVNVVGPGLLLWQRRVLRRAARTDPDSTQDAEAGDERSNGA